MKTVIIRRQQLHGNISQLIKASVLSETKDELRVILEGSNRPIVVKASECVDAPGTFGTMQAMNRGVIVQKALPDSPSCLSRMIERR